MTRNFSKLPYLAAYLAIFTLVCALAFYFHWIDRDRALGMLHEDGLVEVFSAGGWFACLTVMAALGGWGYYKRHYPLVLLVLFFSLRELDFDKRFTETGLLQSRILTSPDVMLIDRIAGILVMVGLIFLVFKLITAYAWLLWKRLKQMDVVALGVVVASIFIVLSKTLDGLGRKLAPLGVSVSDQAIFSATAVEEVFEFGVPLVLIVAAVAFFRQQRLNA